MIKKELLGHLLITFIWLMVVSFLLWQRQTDLIFLWVGGLAGAFLLDLDHILYVLIINSHHPTNTRIRYLLRERQFKEAFILLARTHEERTRLTFHNGLFQAGFCVICFIVLISSGSIFGAGLVLAIALHLLKDETWNLFEGREEYLRSWLFWPINGRVSLECQRLFVVLMFLIFVGLNLFLL